VLLAGFEPAIPEIERLEAYVFDHLATEMAVVLLAFNITPAFIGVSHVVYYIRILFFYYKGIHNASPRH
jgi:hypothetical protein